LAKALRLPNAMSNLHELVLLSCQFLAILAGTFVNYRLNRVFTWPRCVKDVEPLLPPVQSSWGIAKPAAADPQSNRIQAQQ
jgi:hypothetical protein